MSIVKSKTTKVGWTIQPSFTITLHIRDLELLNSVKNFFSVGTILIYKNTAQYRIRNKEELRIIIKHFNEYPLLGDKLKDYKKWKVVYGMILSKEHITDEGRLKIRSLIGKI